MAGTIVQQVSEEMQVLQKELDRFKTTVEYLQSAKATLTEAIQTVQASEYRFDQRVQELKAAYDAMTGFSVVLEGLTSKIDGIDFPARLQVIEHSITQTIQAMDESKAASIREIQAATAAIHEVDFKSQFVQLKHVVNHAAQSNERVAAAIQEMNIAKTIDTFRKSINHNLDEHHKELQKNTRKIALDSTNSIISLNLPNRLDKLDATIAGTLTATQNLQGRIDLLESNLRDRIEQASQRQNAAWQLYQQQSAKKAALLQALGFITLLLLASILLLLLIKK